MPAIRVTASGFADAVASRAIGPPAGQPEQIAVALWSEEAAADAVKNVQVLVSRLRRTLGSRERVDLTPAGYRLRVGLGELDYRLHEALARVHAAAGRERPAVLLLDDLHW